MLGAMKLAEALLLRADLQKKVASLRERVVANAVVQQGDEPHEDPSALMREAFGVMDQLEKTVVQINVTNLGTKLSDGRTMTAAIAGSRKQPDRYGVREIKWVATLKVVSLQKQADDLAKKIRELNGLIQETNWKVELIE